MDRKYVFLLHVFIGISATYGQLRTVYLGCFEDLSKTPDLSYGPYKHPFMTPSKCLDYCRGGNPDELNFTLSAVQNRINCFCGFQSKFKRVQESNCNEPCGGDVNTMCGGVWYNAIYRTEIETNTSQIPGQWTTIVNKATVSPHRRSYSSMVYMQEQPSGTESLIIFGGQTNHYVYVEDNNGTATEYVIDDTVRFNDLWKFDIDRERWIILHNGSGIAPSKRSDHVAIVYGFPPKLYIYAGCNSTGDFLNDVWEFNFESATWRLILDGEVKPSPKPRAGASAFVLRNQMIMFAGITTGYSSLNSVWTLNLETFIWDRLCNCSHSPRPRWGSAGIALPNDNSMLISFGVGECSEKDKLGDVWKFHLDTLKWEIFSSGSRPWDSVNKVWTGDLPSSRTDHVAIATSENNMIIYGGTNGNSMGDIWGFNTETRTWELLPSGVESPYNRSGSSAVVTRGGMVIFGGSYNEEIFFNDVWMWSISSCTFGEPGDRGYIGHYIGGSLLVIWILVFIAVFKNYLPRKLKYLKRKTVEETHVTDISVFRVSNEVRKQEQKVRKELEESMEMIDVPENRVNQFDKLPDELVVKIFVYLRGNELARSGVVCRRFCRLVDDHVIWKTLCTQWEETSEKTPRNFYIDRYQLYLKQKQETQIYRYLLYFRSTYSVYFVLFLFSWFAAFIGFKVDRFLNWSWFYIFIPLWIIEAIFLFGCSALIFSRLKRFPYFQKAFRRAFPLFTANKIAYLISTILLSFDCFTIFLALKLDEIINWGWWVVSIPLIIFLVVTSAVPIILMIRKGRIWSIFWSFFLCLSIDITCTMVISKLAQSIKVDWCLLFLPWWISDIFALVCAICMCMEHHSKRAGWLVTAVFCLYLTSSVSFRSLMCVNLSNSCGDPISHPLTLILLSFHVFLVAVGFPLSQFVKKRFNK